MKRPLLTALLSLAGLALAQGKAPVALTLTMNLVSSVKVDGKTTEQLTPNPGSVLPGQVLSQVVTARNTSAALLRNVPITLPVPKNTVYLAPEQGLGSARAEYSIDGGKTFAPAPLKKTVTVSENGKAVQKVIEVKPSEYTTVRWTVAELGAGQTLKLGYRVQVK
ncbi:hypothetical protein [Deinococcus multiflagellatus]|uniref:DUF11 domain-containing protein n=1 Tax=Deinococcus multiflagellatus TaxID=1656887 RepID=A0ABW1ZL79_9DEIO|nr:hypothetical protein [Deinococcus multiflagellatus]MBZ9712397.1 hypothetical protein [Deinococcus multiflagellatus]